MNNNLNSEINLFLISILSGVCAAIIFDIFRSLRKLGHFKEGRVAFEDILLWISEAVLVFAVLYKFNSGGVRFYFFVGILSGALIYFFTASKYVVMILATIFVLLKKVYSLIFLVLQKTIDIFLFPIKFLCKKIKKVSYKIKINSKKLKKQLKMY